MQFSYTLRTAALLCLVVSYITSCSSSCVPRGGPDVTPQNIAILKTVETKLAAGPSIQAIEPQLVTLDEIAIVKKLADQGNSQARAIYPKLKTLVDEVLAATTPYLSMAISDILNQAEFESSTPAQLDLLFDAKDLWIKLWNNQGSIISLNSFTPDSRFGYKGDPKSGVLELKKLAYTESEQLDEHIVERLIAENKQKRNNKRVVIQGGGPVGLFTAFKLFRTGALVQLYNDRPDNFLRKQIIRLDPKWQANLLLYMGTAFRDLFGLFKDADGKSTLSLGVSRLDGYVETPIQNIEDGLLARVSLLYLGAVAQEPDLADKTLIRYASNITAIKFPTDEHPNFAVEAVANPTGHDLNQTYIPADVIVMAGGANDRNRDIYLSPAFARTNAVLHSIAVWNKLENTTGLVLRKDPNEFRIHMSNAEIADALAAIPTDVEALLIDGSTIASSVIIGPRAFQKPFISPDVALLSIDDFVRNFIATLPSSAQAIKDRYQTPLSELVRHDATEIRRDTGANGVDNRVFENLESIYLADKVPNKIAQLREDIGRLVPENERGPRDPMFVNPYNLFLKNFESKWHYASMRVLTNFSLASSHQMKPDSNFLSQGSFFSEQKLARRTTALYKAPLKSGGEAELLLAAAGDSVVSPHFMTWSGLNAGRATVDALTTALEGFIQDNNGKKFVTDLTAAQEPIKQFILRRGQIFLTPLAEAEVIKKARSETIRVLNSLVTAAPEENLTYGQYQVIIRDPLNNNYGLRYASINDVVSTIDFHVDDEGYLIEDLYPQRGRFLTPSDIYLNALEN